MCGGFVAAYAGGDDEGSKSRATAHFAYNAGRLGTYLGLGAVAGSLGRALDLAGSALGIAHIAAVATSLLLFVMGALALAPRARLIRLQKGPTRGLANLLGPLFARFRSSPSVVRALILGTSSTLLPCGWLYAFAALAAGTGSAAAGATLMSAFWLGSLPVMLAVGFSLRALTQRFARQLSRLRPVVILAAGGVTLLTHLQLPAFAAARESTTPRPTALPTTKDCPCHRAGAARAAATAPPPRGEAR
jgi:sulfite exporter TauE/SafE